MQEGDHADYPEDVKEDLADDLYSYRKCATSWPQLQRQHARAGPLRDSKLLRPNIEGVSAFWCESRLLERCNWQPAVHARCTALHCDVNKPSMTSALLRDAV
jgi:hypothetical protein